MRIQTHIRWLLGVAVLVGAAAQTRLDLQTQSKSVDFSGVPTKPFRTGTTLPATCSVGETFFKVDAPAGKNFYGCTATNTWTLQAVEAPAELPTATGQSGKVLSTDGSVPAWTSLAGDISGVAGALLVQGLQGRTLSPASPADGDVVEWNAATRVWEPGKSSLAGDATGPTTSTIIRGLQGRAVSAAAPANGQTLGWNVTSNRWEPGSPTVILAGDATGPAGSAVVRGLQSRAVSTTAPVDGQGLKWNGTVQQWEPGSPIVALAGDATGSAGSTVVRGLQSRAVSPTAPADGQGLKWNDTSRQWEPGNPITTLTGDANGPSGSTVVKALQGNAVSPASPMNGGALTWNGVSNRWEPGTPSITLTGDSTGPAGSNVVRALQGRAVTAAAPVNGSALEWNASANQWEPTPIIGSVSGDATGPMSSTVVQALQGRAITARMPADGQALTWSSGLNQWQPSNVISALIGDANGPANATVVKALQGRPLSTAAPADGQGLKWNSALNQWEPGSGNGVLTGDASGPASNTTVKGLQGRPIATTSPADGQALQWNGGLSQWEPANVANVLTGDASGPAGATVVKALQGRAVSVIAPSNGDGLKWDSVLNQWEPGSSNVTLAGDASGPSGSSMVRGLQGRPISTAVPSDGQTLRWDGTLNQWAPASPMANYSAAFTTQTALTIPGSAHGYGTANLLLQCYDTTGAFVEPSSVAINSSTYDVAIAFSAPQSGRCVVNGGALEGGGSSGGGGTSPVVSVFGRAGIVTGATGDYGFSQIAGTVANAQLPTGIDAGKIGPGTVSSSAFGTLANVRSDVQAQIDGKAALGHIHPLAGDLAGNTGAAVVTGIRGQPVAATSATDGQVLTWNAITSQWEPRSSTTSASGALSVLGVQIASPTTLTIGAACSAVTPCNVRIGDTVQSIQAPSTATITGGTGAAYIYVDQDGILTVGHNLTVACTGGCSSQQGITAFPSNAIPIASWSASAGTWNGQGTDWRSWLSTKVLDAGVGMMTIDSGSRTTIAIDTTAVPTYLSGSATLDFPAIADRACSSDMVFSVPGASPGDTVAPGWPGTLPWSLFGTMFVSGLDTVSARLCNLSGITVDPAPATYRATIIRSF